jgi:hypothetical protein
MHNPTVVHRHAVLGLSGVPASLCACVPPAYVKYYTQEDTPATGLVAEPKGASPPRQLELAPPGAAEFVICDHTIELVNWELKSGLGLGEPQVSGDQNRSEKSVGIAVLASLFVLRVCHHEIIPGKPWSIFQLQHALRLRVMTKQVEHKVKVTMAKTRKAA